MVTHRILGILVKPRYYDRTLQSKTTQFTSIGANVGVDIYKGLQIKILLEENLSIVAAKYQLLKMQEDIALNVANAFLKCF
jgi:outer membrane protein